VWRRNGLKAVHVKRGDLRGGQRAVFMLREEPKSHERNAGVRAPIGATKRL